MSLCHVSAHVPNFQYTHVIFQISNSQHDVTPINQAFAHILCNCPFWLRSHVAQPKQPMKIYGK